jgi:thiol-disulfide isomerase/thioredoxin
VLAWCVYLVWFGPKQPRRSPTLEGTALSQPADYDWALKELDGRPATLAPYRGKTVFLNIWATWCPPCVAELPSIARLAGTPGLEQVAFVCVSVDRDAETVRRFLQGKGWPLTVLHATDAPPVFATEGIPATFLIAPDGRVAASVIGGAEWDDPSVVAFLQGLGRGP